MTMRKTTLGASSDPVKLCPISLTARFPTGTHLDEQVGLEGSAGNSLAPCDLSYHVSNRQVFSPPTVCSVWSLPSASAGDLCGHVSPVPSADASRLVAL